MHSLRILYAHFTSTLALVELPRLLARQLVRASSHYSHILHSAPGLYNQIAVITHVASLVQAFAH